MNIIEKYELYKKFLNTKPVYAVHMDWKKGNFYRIKMEYKINGTDLTLNAFVYKDILFGYGANIMDNQNKVIAKFYNPLFAKKLYEHGQRYL